MSSGSSSMVPPCSTPTLDEDLEDWEIVATQNTPRGRVELTTDSTGIAILEAQNVARPGDSESHNVDEGKTLPRQYLETILHTRYGMKPCPQSVLDSLPSYNATPTISQVRKYMAEKDVRVEDATPTISQVRKYMAEKDVRVEDDDHVASIRYIFLHVNEGKPLPPALWDLQDSNISLKKVAYSFRFVCETRLIPAVYRIIPLNGRYVRSWTLVVPHATTVLQVIRNEWGPSLEDLIEEFVSLGIPFFTPGLSSTPPPDRLPRPKTVFDNFFRPFPFQPNAHTYTTYELQREDFLTHPHARAALLRGGILWRLCKTSFEGRLGLVNGPSSDVSVFGEARLFSPTTKDEASTWAWDDALTGDEMDLICGVYHVGAEVSGQQQWTTLSWWPLPSEFNNSNLWTGYWNASCEFWFQRRLKSIRCGEAKPFTVSDWKKELKCSRRKTKKLWDLTENASARFIDKVLG